MDKSLTLLSISLAQMIVQHPNVKTEAIALQVVLAIKKLIEDTNLTEKGGD